MTIPVFWNIILNASTVTLRVVGGNKKISLESETVEYPRESHGAQTWKLLLWRGPAAIVNDRPTLSSERMLHKDYDRNYTVGGKVLVVSLKELVAKTNLLAVNSQI
jgi:hypothetical protein